MFTAYSRSKANWRTQHSTTLTIGCSEPDQQDTSTASVIIDWYSVKLSLGVRITRSILIPSLRCLSDMQSVFPHLADSPKSETAGFANRTGMPIDLMHPVLMCFFLSKIRGVRASPNPENGQWQVGRLPCIGKYGCNAPFGINASLCALRTLQYIFQERFEESDHLARLFLISSTPLTLNCSTISLKLPVPSFSNHYCRPPPLQLSSPP